MSMERWDILDQNGRTTGRTIARGQAPLHAGEYHLVVHIWIVNDRGELLLQRRAEDKELMPGEWAATGGAAIAGETSSTAARRELREELGIEAAERDMKFLYRMTRKNSFVDVWLVRSNADLRELSLQEDEVCDVKWASVKTLRHMISCGEYHNYGNDYFSLLLQALEPKENGYES